MRVRRHGPPSLPRGALADEILRIIWKERTISRADLARETDLARSTVSTLVGSLLPTGLVAEVGPGPSSGGRRPIVLAFQDDVSVILGVEMGANHIAVALTDLRGSVKAWHYRAHPVREEPGSTRRAMADMCDQCLADAGYSPRQLVGIGIAAPSPINPASPNRLSRVVMPAWDGRLDVDFLAEAYGVPIMVDNDANMGALAERWWGAGRDVDHFAYVKVSTGVGCGHVIDGEIYRGASGVAGEIGHLNVDPSGAPCVCGHRGCLVTLVGAHAIVERAQALLDEYPESRLRSGNISAVAIEDAALAGDALASRLIDETAGHLGVAFASMLNLLNPSLVIVGGGLARLDERLLTPLREAVMSRTLVSSIAAAEIRTSDLGPRSVAVGAATLVLKSALADSRLFPSVARMGVR